MNREPIDIVRVVRSMRGGSQAQLVQGQDGLFYVAKFTGNPQGTRTLINEWFASQLLQQLNVATPHLRVLRLTPAIQKSAERLVFLQGNTRVPSEPGLHLGSECPVNPEKTAIFDFLPRNTLTRLANPEDFPKTLVLDQFLGQTDARQAIFVREMSGNAARFLRAYMIDHGRALGGTLWQLANSPHFGLYRERMIYSLCDLSRECEQALEQVFNLTDEHLQRLSETIPPVWFARSDAADWARLLRQLSERKHQLPGLLERCLHLLRVYQQNTQSESEDGKRAGLRHRAHKLKQPVAEEMAFLPLG